MKTNFQLAVVILLATFAAQRASAEPQVDSWLTTYSGKYAHIYTNDTMKANGSTVTTWSNGQQTQSLPAYCGAQQIFTSSNYVYVRSTGLGSHVMGPWWNNSAHTAVFVNLPANQKMIYKFPRTPTPATTHTAVQGEVGMMVDGVRIFDSGDAFSYSYSSGQDATAGNGLSGDGLWNREAWSNEGTTMDPAYAHQQNTGRYHYHATPIALRYLLGDNVTFDPVSKIYSPSTNAPTKHSPIIGWIQDGYPIYGPYGYSSASNSSSGIRRMVPGYVKRDGTSGSVNLTTTGRVTFPTWRAREGNRSATLSASEYGPAVSTTYPIGHYEEDYEYLGDLGKVLAVDFDLDEYNGRWCVTPEFPNGTYAYFAAIDASGTPVYPYNTGRQYYGVNGGALVSSITENVVTNFDGGPNAPLTLNPPAISNNVMTLLWSATEGGTYRVESSTDVATWSTNAGNIAATLNTGSYTQAANGSNIFYRVARTNLAAYDSVISTTGGGILSVAPTSANRGTTFTLTINLDPSLNPPPAVAPINSVTVGTITGTSNVHVSQTQVTTSITIPANATPGAQTVTVVFPGPPGNPTATVTYTLPAGFTIK
ncbi:MAG: hypothetical protein JWO95_2544 [Verrucomicrobiales bacterium]|nr:hypothetical protein [Verrucomicrobiales bacterium]